MNYDYHAAVKEDLKNHILEYMDENDLKIEDLDRDEISDNAWLDDGVTGNGSGSYTLNRYQAEENLCHNWSLLADAMEEFGDTSFHIFEKGAEAADVTIICYLLSQVIDDVIEEIEQETEV